MFSLRGLLLLIAEEGAFRGMDPELFFPGTGDSVGMALAKAVCDQCPVRRECLDYAILAGEQHGVWGGMSERARRRIRRRRELRDQVLRRVECGSWPT